MAGPLLQVVDARERVKSLLERGEPVFPGHRLEGYEIGVKCSGGFEG